MNEKERNCVHVIEINKRAGALNQPARVYSIKAVTKAADTQK